MSVDLGLVPASSTLYIPFASYGKTNGESITISNFAVGDILIYKNGSVTQRASTSGFTLLDTDGIDFDSQTGIHGFSIDLSDNTTAGFYAVGSFYWVVVGPITIDSQTVNFIAATFRIGPAEANVGYQPVDATYVGGGTPADTSDNATALLDLAAGVTTGLTVRQQMRLSAAALFGKSSGHGTPTVIYRDFTDAKNAITASVAASGLGNRTAVTTDAT